MSSEKQLSLTESQHSFITSKQKFSLFAGGIGCVHESTLLDTPLGPTPISDCDGSYFSFDGRSVVPSQGTAPFPKGKGDLFRVVHEQGEFVAYGSHLIFSAGREYRSVQNLSDGESLFSVERNSFDQRLSTLDIFQKELLEGDPRSMGIVEDFLMRCSIYFHQYDLQLPSVLGSARSFVPLLVDALEFARSFSRGDGLSEPRSGHIRLDQSVFPLSMMGSFRRAANPPSVLAGFLQASILERILSDNQSSKRSQTMIGRHHIDALYGLCRTLVSCVDSPYKSTSILAIEKHSFDWYWDLQVPNFHNYTAHGVVHHNSGKSFAGAHWAREKIASEPHAKGLIGANTYNQLRNATLTTFFGVLDDFNIPYSYNQQRNTIDVAGRLIYAYSLENYESLRGIEVGWFWLDEVRDTKEQAFKVAIGRLRDRKANHLEGRLTSSPCGYNWLYDYFAGNKKTEDYEIIQGSSFDNPFLPDGYIESLRSSYDEKTFQQEVLGRFVNTGQGQVYYAFSRDRNVKPVIRDPKFPIMVGMDFNVNPMTAVIFQCIDNRIHVIDEIWQQGSRTETMGEYLQKNYGRGLQIIPDSTGQKQTTNSNRSDHEILKDMGFQVVYNRNPARMDRYNVVNNLMEKDRLIVSPRCVHLIKDLEQVSFKEGSSQLDVSMDKSLTHVSDALGYGAWYCFPIVRPTSGVYSF